MSASELVPDRLLAASVAIAATIGAAWLTEEALEAEPQIWDAWFRPPAHWQGGLLEPGLHVLGAFSTVGSGTFLLFAAAVLVAWLAASHRWLDATFVLVSVQLAHLAGRVGKSEVGRLRPSTQLGGYFLPGGVKMILVVAVLGLGAWLVRRRLSTLALLGASVLAFSLLDALIRDTLVPPRGLDAFPSGHATSSATFAAIVVVLAWRTPRRWPVLVIGGLYAAAVGLSRVLLGYHHASDVVGGWFLALSVTVLVRACLVGARRPDDATAPAPATGGSG